jgi:cytochrome P450
MVGEFFAYIGGALADRAQNPRDDLLSGLVHAEADGLKLDPSEQVTMAVTLLVAGNETVRAMLSGGCRLLAGNPDQRELLLARPDLMGNAVEEILRCSSPILNFCRTATETTEIRGQKIERGDYVLMLFVAGNRDEGVFDRSEVFDVSRTFDSTHMAFGFGPHFCLGAALARLEAQIAFRRLIERFPNFELAGEVVRTRSTATSNIDTMPVRFQ